MKQGVAAALILLQTGRSIVVIVAGSILAVLILGLAGLLVGSVQRERRKKARAEQRRRRNRQITEKIEKAEPFVSDENEEVDFFATQSEPEIEEEDASRPDMDGGAATERKRKSRRYKAIGGAAGGLAVMIAIVGFIIIKAGKAQETSHNPQIAQAIPFQMADPEQEMRNGFLIQPKAVMATNPETAGVHWETLVSGRPERVARGDNGISFQGPSQYFALPGIATFRGDHYRTGGAYGTVAISQKRFSPPIWSVVTDTLLTSEGTSAWTGSGWTGQPLVVQWDPETRQQMNLFEEKKNKDLLIEVIYATLDGHIYFLDMEDGAYTREPVSIGMAFKGSGSLDPRGYPLMYVGSGDNTLEGQKPRMYIVSLIDGTVLYEYGDDDPEALRIWSGFDSSPLVDAESDTLIWPGENGILYTIKLNTIYDRAAGTISIQPDHTVKTRYTTRRSSDASYWLGYECSASIMDHYIYLSENGGMFYCVDLNTMQLVWVQDTKDDSNGSPVAEYDPVSGKAAVYTAPSLHWTADSDGAGSISIYKLNALTGEIVWNQDFDCFTVEGVSGGVQATPVLGKAGSSIENLIIYPIARTPNPWDGILVAFDTETGEEVWRYEMDFYTWSSPVAVYTDDGTAYLVLFDSEGNGFLLEGATGAVLDQIDVGSLVEASPVVYENTVIVGTRGQRIYAMKLE